MFLSKKLPDGISCAYTILPLLGLALHAANPIIMDVHTADPAALVHDGAVYLYTGHDEAPERENRYVMKEWLCFPRPTW